MSILCVSDTAINISIGTLPWAPAMQFMGQNSVKGFKSRKEPDSLHLSSILNPHIILDIFKTGFLGITVLTVLKLAL